MKFQELFSYIGAIEAKLGYVFHTPELLLRAFVHRSYLNENKDEPCLDNERLEFLGDSVLNFLVAEYLYQNLPDVDEGKLSSLRAQAISSTACSRYFEKLQIQEFMLVGRGETIQAGKTGRSSIVADMFEALLGAIYLDGGMDKAKTFFMQHFQKDLFDSFEKPEQNWKALLQEFTQKKWQKMPAYKVLQETGPDHNREFTVGVYIENELIGQGSGPNKKEAERQAAEQALEKLQKDL
jgi:ribonuclease-3